MASPARDFRNKAQAQWPGATVHGRGRNWIRHQHPSDPARFMLDASIGPIHYGTNQDQEIDTAWQVSSGVWDYEVTANEFESYVRDSVPVSYRYVDVATGHYVEITWDAVQWVNDEGDSENAASFSQVTPVISDDIIRWNDIAAGWDVRIEAQTARLAKWLTIDSLAALGAPTIGGTNIRLRFRLSFTRSSGLDIYVDGTRWAGANNTWMETGGNIEFRNIATGLPVFWFKRPIGKDANSNQPAMIQRVRRTGNVIYSEIDTPYSWLQTATYPIELDDTIEPQVGAGADDTTAYSGDLWFNDGYTIYVGEGPGVANAKSSFRVTGISGLSGATVTTSYFSPFFSNYGSAVKTNIFADDSEAPTAPTSYATFVGKTLTTASVAWDDATSSNEFTDSPSINAIIQELCDDYDPSAIQIFWLNDGSASNNYHSVYAYESSSSWGAIIHIEYTAGGGDYSVSKSEGVTLGESQSVQIADALAASQSEGVTLGEAAVAQVTIDTIHSDGVTLGDTATVTLDDLAVSVSEGVTLGESQSVQIADDLAVNVTDGVTLGESSNAEFGAVADYEINVSDGVTVGEAATARLGDLEISRAEGVTIGDTGAAALADALAVSRSDGVTVGEAASAVLESFISKSEGVTVGEAASADLRAAWYNPDVLTVNTGSVVSGTIEDTWSDNGVKLQLAEVTGTPGFDYDFIFYNVPADAYSITINGYYQGNPAHNVKIQQYNFTTLNWTNLSPDSNDFPSTASDQDYQFALFGGVNYNSSGEVRIKIVHTSAGNITHNFYIDQMLMSAQNLAVHVPDEGVTLGESWAAALADDLAVSISDGVTLGEAAQANVSEIGALDISVSDGVTVGDGGAIAIGDLGIAIDPAYLIYWTAGVEVVG